jgi:hypothetical protein
MTGTYCDTANTLGTLTTLENKLTYTRPQLTPQQAKTKTTNSQKTLPTFRSEAHRQVSTQTAQEAHTAPEVSNLGQTDPQTHLIATLCLLKPSQRRKLLQGLSLEEEEAKNRPQDPATKTHNESEMSSTSRSDEPLDPLEDLEALTAMEDQEDPQTYPLPTLSLFSLPTI